MQGTLVRLQHVPADVARLKKAQAHLLGGRHRLALAGYQELVRRYPNAPELWFELGGAAAGELDFALANQAYLRARELAPGNASLLGSIGQQYQGLRQLDDARRCYERAVEVNPGLVDAHINLAVWLEKERRLDDSWERVQNCLKRFPGNDQARYFEAFLLHRMKRHEEAESKLRDLIRDGPRYPYVQYAAPHLLGVVLDQLGRYDEAMDWLVRAKAGVRALTDISLLERGYDEGVRQRRAFLSALTPDVIRRWREEAPDARPDCQVALLGGHPRSGTTLLEQILDAHPEVLAFDEPVAFSQEISKRIQHGASRGARGGDPDALSAAARGEMRERYVKSLMREVPGRACAPVLLDKNPSVTQSLDLMLRVFPEMKVIIALRDPRDVLISCYFLNIMLNATNVNFLSLERTATHYRDLMDVWLRMRDLGGFDWIESRYEDLVQDMEPEGRRITGFLGRTWHEDQMRFFETARRKVLYAPTYHDVTQPVYQGAVGRWERYARFIEPLRDKLAPYGRAFGYDI